MKKIIIGLCVLGVAGFNSSVSAGNMHNKKHKNRIDRHLRAIVMQNNLTGDPLQGRTVPDINTPQVQLGRDLFFSKTLGGDFDSACVACHHPMLGGGDNLSLPIGVEADEPDLLGIGRTNDDAEFTAAGEAPVPRNAPTTFNVIAWDQFQFHDGRVESLDKIPGANGANIKNDGTYQGIRTPDSSTAFVADDNAGQNLVQAQARFPVTSNEEMKGFEHTGLDNDGIRNLIADRLGSKANWQDKFRLAFPGQDKTAATALITEQNVSWLIAEYERSQAFVETPWKKYIEGDKQAISLNAKKGALLFYTASTEGGADCSSCHQGDFFTDESFHNLAMPQIGPGKGDGDGDGSKDFGRQRETGKKADKFAFRTPSLINVEVTGPWSHAGAYATLEAVVKHHLDPAAAINSYDPGSVSEAYIGVIDLAKVQENTQEALDADSFFRKGQAPIELSSMQIGFLVEFLKSLTDPCTQSRECLIPWIPAVIEDENHDQLDAYDEQGTLL